MILKRLVREYEPSVGASVWKIRSDNPDKRKYPDKIWLALPAIAGRAICVGRAFTRDIYRMKNAISYESGVGGWLALLIAILIAIGPLLGFGNLYGTFSDAERQLPELASNARWTTYVQVTWTLFAGFAGMGIAAGYRLWKIHRKDSIRFAVITLWVIGPAANIAHAITGAIALNKGMSANDIAASLGELAASCIIAAVWTVYLRRSSRVKNTYR